MSLYCHPGNRRHLTPPPACNESPTDQKVDKAISLFFLFSLHTPCLLLPISAAMKIFFWSYLPFFSNSRNPECSTDEAHEAGVWMIVVWTYIISLPPRSYCMLVALKLGKGPFLWPWKPTVGRLVKIFSFVKQVCAKRRAVIAYQGRGPERVVKRPEGRRSVSSRPCSVVGLRGSGLGASPRPATTTITEPPLPN